MISYARFSHPKLMDPLQWHCHTKLQKAKTFAAAIPLLAFTAAPLLSPRQEVQLFASPLSHGCRSTRSPATMRRASSELDGPVYGRFPGADVVGLEWRTEPLEDEIPIPWLAKACHGLSARKLFARRKDLPASRDMYHSTIYVLLSFEAFLLFRSAIRLLFPWTAQLWIRAPRRRIFRWEFHENRKPLKSQVEPTVTNVITSRSLFLTIQPHTLF